MRSGIFIYLASYLNNVFIARNSSSSSRTPSEYAALARMLGLDATSACRTGDGPIHSVPNCVLTLAAAAVNPPSSHHSIIPSSKSQSVQTRLASGRAPSSWLSLVHSRTITNCKRVPNRPTLSQCGGLRHAIDCRNAGLFSMERDTHSGFSAIHHFAILEISHQTDDDGPIQSVAGRTGWQSPSFHTSNGGRNRRPREINRESSRGSGKAWKLE